MSGATVRVAATQDADTLGGLRRSWVEERWGPAVDPDFVQRFGQWWSDERHRRSFWLAELDDAAVGMVNLTTFTRMPTPGRAAGAWGYLGNMFVVEPHRGMGIGRLLLDALIAHADAQGLVRIVLSPSERSVPFYRRAGFDAADELLLRRRA